MLKLIFPSLITLGLEKEISIQENLDKNCAIHTINSEIDTIIKLRDGLDSSLTKALDVMQKLTMLQFQMVDTIVEKQ